MTLHYSVRFNYESLKYHGEAIFLGKMNEPEMIKTCRLSLIVSIKNWGYVPEDLTFSEFYFYENGKEINFFKWEK